MVLKKIMELKKQKRKLIIGVMFLVVIVIFGIFAISKIGGNEPEVSVISESSLKEILKIDELSTLEYFYNSVATVSEEDSEKIKYYVAYEGAVRFGIDFEEIDISIDTDSKEVIVTIPDIKVVSFKVKQETMDFIFIKDKYETETVLTEAYSVCLSDLETKVLAETSLFDMAKENAVSSIEALICPWVEQVDGEYTVSIK